jgi:hypothetical protein
MIARLHRATYLPSTTFQPWLRSLRRARTLWAHPIPRTLVWTPLAEDPVVRRTWAVWSANARHRDVAQLITAFEQLGTLDPDAL